MGIRSISSAELKAFEDHFDFHIMPAFRVWLLEHNAGIPKNTELATAKKNRHISYIMDFSRNAGASGAWKSTERCRKEIGNTRIIVGIDNLGNFICLSRHYRHQQIELWNHITGEFEPCLLDISAFIRLIG